MAEKPQGLGLLGDLFGKTPFGMAGITPQLSQKEIVVEMTQEQLRVMLLQNADARAKDSVTIELHEGILVLKIRLF
jgi:hypothetical protein